VCRTGDDVDFKGAILRTCAKRNDKHAEDVRLRVEGSISDLHAAEARYHVDCRARFMTTKHVKAASASTCSESNAYDLALSQVTDAMKGQNLNIWNSVEINDLYSEFGGSQLQRKGLMSRIEEYFGNELVGLHSPGLANMIVFKEVAPNLIKLVNTKDDDDLDFALKVVAKHIIDEDRDINYDPTIYNTRINTEMLSSYVSDTVSCLLSKLSPNIENTNPGYMIGNMITAAIGKHPTPLQIA